MARINKKFDTWIIYDGDSRRHEVEVRYFNSHQNGREDMFCAILPDKEKLEDTDLRRLRDRTETAIKAGHTLAWRKMLVVTLHRHAQPYPQPSYHQLFSTQLGVDTIEVTEHEGRLQYKGHDRIHEFSPMDDVEEGDAVVIVDDTPLNHKIINDLIKKMQKAIDSVDTLRALSLIQSTTCPPSKK